MRRAVVLDRLFYKVACTFDPMAQIQLPYSVGSTRWATRLRRTQGSYSRSLTSCVIANAHDERPLQFRNASFSQERDTFYRAERYKAELASWDPYIEPEKKALDRTDAYLAELSDEQRTAVTAMQKVVRVVAGPGSGKTRVLIARTAYLLAQGESPESILILTFTNKAAKEVQERLEKLYGGPKKLRSMWACTFHSAAARILRKHITRLDDKRKRGFQIIDAEESQKVMLDIYMEKESVPIYSTDGPEVKKAKQKQNRALKAGMLKKGKLMQSRIAYVKERLPTVDGVSGETVATQYEAASGRPLYDREDFIWSFEQYQQKLKEHNWCDYGDLLSCTVRLLRDHKFIRQEYKTRFSHILVDEMQDTNGPQYEFLRLLVQDRPDVHTKNHAPNKLFTVGDPNQGIYSFRGAKMENMLEAMDTDFPNSVRTLHLLDNYRSLRHIVHAAESVLKRSLRNSLYKEMHVRRTERIADPKLIRHFVDARQEAAYIAQEVLRLRLEHGLEYNEIAILYRNHILHREVEKALVQATIPYYVRGQSFWERAEVKDVVAYLRFILNPSDFLAFDRIYNKPKRGFGDTSVLNLKAWCKLHDKPFPQCLADDLLDIDSKAESLEDVEIPELDIAKHAGLTNSSRKGLHCLRQTFVFLRSVARHGTPEDTMKALMDECGYKQFINQNPQQDDSETQKRLNNIDALIESASEVVSIEESNAGLEMLTVFVQEASLLIDAVDKRDSNGVQLMTIHAVKGLEFNAVFVVGCEQEIIPRDEEIEEAARLVFVAMTRAKNYLRLTWVIHRAIHGKPRVHNLSEILKGIELQQKRTIRCSDDIVF